MAELTDKKLLVDVAGLSKVAQAQKDYVDAKVKGIDDAVKALDLTEVGGTGKVITTISQADGKVAATATDLTATNVAATKVGTGTATDVQGILGELSDRITSVATQAIALEDGNGTTVTEGTGNNMKVDINLVDNDPYLQLTGNKLGSKGIDDAIEAAVEDAVEDLEAQIEAVSGAAITVTGSNAIDVTGEGTTKTISLKVKSGDYLTVTDQGLSTTGIDTAISGAIDDLDVASKGGDGKYIKAIAQTDGKIEATEADLTATVVTATAVGDGSATTVQGILGELNTAITGVKGSAITSITSGNGIAATGEGNSRTVAVKVADGETYLVADANGLHTTDELETMVDTKIAAELEDIESAISDLEDGAFEITNGNGISITGDDTKTIAAVVASGDKYITLTTAGIGTKAGTGENTAIDDAIKTAVDKLESDIKKELADRDKQALAIEDGDGIVTTASEGKTKISIKLDNSGESFLTVGTGGLKLDGVQDAIDAAKAEATLTAGDGIAVSDKKISIKLDATGDASKYISVGEAGLKLNGIDKAISDAIDTLIGSKDGIMDTLGAIQEWLLGAGDSGEASELVKKINEAITNKANTADVWLKTTAGIKNDRIIYFGDTEASTLLTGDIATEGELSSIINMFSVED